MWPVLLAWLVCAGEAGPPTAPAPLTIAPNLHVSKAPIWIEGGTRLALLADQPGGSQWYTAPLDGGDPEPLAVDPTPESPELLWWSPAGDRFAYVGHEKGLRLLLVGRRGAAESMMFAAIGDVRPTIAAWSGDGSRLAFGIANPPTARNAFDLFSCHNDGAHGNRLILHTAALGVAWDDHGTVMAFVSADPGRPMLFAGAPSVGKAWSLSSHSEPLPHSLAFSPDGRILAFAAHPPAEDGAKLYLTRPDGAVAPTLLDRPGYLADGAPVWSPDSRHLCFTTGSLLTPDEGPLWLVDCEHVVLGPVKLSDGFRGGTEPAFSPDSQLLAFVACQDFDPRRAQLVVQPVDKPVARRVLDAGPNVAWPVFAPDGKRVAWIGDGRVRVADAVTPPGG
jgi:Tol biopolymer transport system component